MESPTVFISYSHDSPDHEANVLALANRLRADGIDAVLVSRLRLRPCIPPSASFRAASV